MTRIRRAAPGDFDRVIEIWRAAVDATHHFLSQADRLEIDDEVHQLVPKLPLWLAIDDSDVAIAFMSLTGDSLDALFVHPAHHGAGVGRSLLNHALELCPALTTTVNEQNVRALGFYERLGFVRIGRDATDEQGRSYPVLHLRIEHLTELRISHDHRDTP